MDNILVYDEKLIISACELLEEDLNPMFDRLMDPYPYTMQGHRSSRKKDTEYETKVLENDFLKLIVVPSLGGRLYSTFDKVNNREVFYRNPVILPRMIGKRGAWFSGGVEFNFPFGHAPTTMDRVNCTTANYEDGSASIIIGNIELVSGMNWKVELKLYPGKANIEENVRLYNPTVHENSFFFWTNAAVEYNENIKLIYPFDWCTNAIEPNYIRWPYYKNIDCSRVCETPFSYETFGKLMKDSFFGIYDFGKDCGVVHLADRKKVKGAKYFTWGFDGRAQSWYRALTDDGSKYFEIQSGPFESQKVFKFLKPHQELAWSEYWFPVSGINGFKHIEKQLAVNYEFTSKKVKFMFYATEKLEDCIISLKAGGIEYEAFKTFIPCKNDEIAFELDEPFYHGSKFELNIYSRDAHILSLSNKNEFMEEYPETGLYEDSRVVTDKESEKELFNFAIRQESFRKPEEALGLYKRTLEKNPGCVLTLNRMGGLLIKKEMLREAEDCFRNVLGYDNRNSEARFHLAVVEKEKGNLVKAGRLFMDIACSENYYLPSVIELVKIKIMQGLFSEATSILESHNSDLSSYMNFLLCICFRKDNLPNKAGWLLSSVKSGDEYIRAEKFILGCEENDDSFIKFTCGDERVLVRIALEYMEMNLFSEAGEILQLVSYPGLKTRLLEFHISHKSGKPCGLTLPDILNGSLDRVFVSEAKIAGILRKYRESDLSGTICYLLGTYLYSIGRKDEALDLLLSSYNMGLRYTVLLRNIGYIYYFYKKEPAAATRFYEEDLVHNGGCNEDCLVTLDRIYRENGDIGARKKLIPYMERVKNRSLVLVSLVNIYRDVGEEDKALEILENDEFENWEGFEISGYIYRSVVAGAAMKEAAAGNLQEAGRLMDTIADYPDKLNGRDSERSVLSDMFYYKGMIYSLSGEENRAVEEFKKGAVDACRQLVIETNESRVFSRKCLEELHKRGVFY